MDDAQVHDTDAPEQPCGRTPEGSVASSRNSIVDGLRSLTQFPAKMQERIDDREKELIAELKPKTSLERRLILEMARAEVQKDTAFELLHDAERLKNDVDETWSEDQQRQVNNMAARLARDPQRVADRLQETKQGVEWMLEMWRGLAASAAANGGLTEPQRELALDLKGVSLLLRDNTRIVPAAGDKDGILKLIDSEVKHLEERLQLVLNKRDTAARGKTREGLLPATDAATKKYKSDEARAHKRHVWAFESFKWVRMGMPASAIIDPATGKPLQDGDEGATPKPPPPGTSAAESPAPTPDANPTPTSAAAAIAVSGSDLQDSMGGRNDALNLPIEGLSLEDRALVALGAEAVRQRLAAAILRRAGNGPPPTAG
jgi:hypothetical protein